MSILNPVRPMSAGLHTDPGVVCCLRLCSAEVTWYKAAAVLRHELADLGSCSFKKYEDCSLESSAQIEIRNLSCICPLNPII